MTTDIDNLFRLRKAQVKPAAEMLARAFQNNPVYIYAIPNADERKKTLPHIFQFRIRYGVLYGEVYTISPNLEGLAMWIPSEKVYITLWRMLRARGLLLYLKAGKKIISRLKSVGDYGFPIHKRHADFPHWHLSSIAVDPSCQGKGYARTLIKTMLTRIDQEELPCFLDTQIEKNVSIYQRYGFKIVERGVIPGTEIPHWAMLREKP